MTQTGYIRKCCGNALLNIQLWLFDSTPMYFHQPDNTNANFVARVVILKEKIKLIDLVL